MENYFFIAPRGSGGGLKGVQGGLKTQKKVRFFLVKSDEKIKNDQGAEKMMGV